MKDNLHHKLFFFIVVLIFKQFVPLVILFIWIISPRENARNVFLVNVKTRELSSLLTIKPLTLR